jgi:hypothetical protein
MESSWYERGTIILLNLEDEEDASKLNLAFKHVNL